jgi:hypothetical protein
LAASDWSAGKRLADLAKRVEISQGRGAYKFTQKNQKKKQKKSFK